MANCSICVSHLPRACSCVTLGLLSSEPQKVVFHFFGPNGQFLRSRHNSCSFGNKFKLFLYFPLPGLFWNAVRKRLCFPSSQEVQDPGAGVHHRMRTTRQSRSVLEGLAQKLRHDLLMGELCSLPTLVCFHGVCRLKSALIVLNWKVLRPSPLPLATSRSIKKDPLSKAVSNKEKEFLGVGERAPSM